MMKRKTTTPPSQQTIIKIVEQLPVIEQVPFDTALHNKQQWDAMQLATESRFDWLDHITDDGYENLIPELRRIADLRRSTIQDVDDARD